MHRAATGWVRRGGGNFAEVPQRDTEEHGSQTPRQPSRQSSHEKRTSDQFRQHVQNLLQQGIIESGLETQSLHSSPALSDTTLTSGDYLEVHENEYHEVDIGNYVEYQDYYGPQPTNISPTKSLKAGLGIEVRHVSIGSDSTIDERLFIDDPLADISYNGSEGNIEQEGSREIPNYKPLILKRWFLFVLFVTLFILLALTELTVHLIPDEPNQALDADDDNLTESQLRSRSSDLEVVFDGELVFSSLQGRKHHHRDEDADGGEGEVIDASSTTSQVEVSVIISIDDPISPSTTTTSPIEVTTSSEPVKESPSTESIATILPIPTTPTTADTTTTAVEIPTASQDPTTQITPTTTDIATEITSPPSPPTTPTIKPNPPPITDTTNTQTEDTTTKHSTPGGLPTIQTSLPDESPSDPGKGGTEPAPTSTSTSPLSPPPTVTPPIETTTTPAPQPSDGSGTNTNPHVTDTKPPGGIPDPGTTAEPTIPKPPVEPPSPIPTEIPDPSEIPHPTSATKPPVIPGASDIISILPISIPTTNPDEPATDRLSILPIDLPTTKPEISILPIDTEKPHPTPTSDPTTPTNLPPTNQPPPGPSPNPTTPTDQPTTDWPPISLPTEPAPTTTQSGHTIIQPVPTTTQPVPTTQQPAPTTIQPAPTTMRPIPTTTQPGPNTPSEAPTNKPTDLPPVTSKPPADEPTQKPPPQPTQGDSSKGKPPHDEPTQGQPTTTPPSPTSGTTTVSPSQSSKASSSVAKDPVPELTPPTTVLLESSHATSTVLGTLTLLTTSVTTKFTPTSKSGLVQIEYPSSDVPEISTKPPQSTATKTEDDEDDEDENPFSTLIPFTTLIVTDGTSTHHTLATSATSATLTLELTASGYRNFTDEFGLGQKFLESALTYYTPIEGGKTKEPIWALKTLITAIETNSHGKPTKTQTKAILYGSQTTVLTNYQGVPTQTVTYYVVPYATTMTDEHGRPTATTTVQVSEVPVTQTLTDENGLATRTVTNFLPMSSTTIVRFVTPTAPANSSNIGNMTTMRVTDAQYFGVLMLPTLLAIALAIPIRILDRTAKLYQPFHAMTAPRGAPASESLCLETRGPRSLLFALHSAMNGQYLLSLTGTLVLASAVLIPLSGEIMHIAFQGPDCATAEDGDGGNNPVDCTVGVAVLPNTARAVVGILAFMVVLLCGTAVVLWRWTTGVARPWSLNYMAHLSSNNDIQLLLRRMRGRDGKITTDRVTREFGSKSFILGYWKENSVLRYGIYIPNSPKYVGKSVTFSNPKKRSRSSGDSKSHTMPFFLLTFAGRLIFLSFLLAVLIFVLVYHITGEGRIGWIMIGESIGVRILFTVVGVLIAFAWESFFYAVAFLSPFRFLNRKHSPHNQREAAKQMTPPTNVFSGVWTAFARRPRDMYLGIVAIAGIFAQLLPLLLSNVPFEALQSYRGFEPSTWVSVVILCVMMFIIIGSFVIRWPQMPIDPTTVAGAMHYATDPTGLSSVTGMSPSAGLLHGRVDTGLV